MAEYLGRKVRQPAPQPLLQPRYGESFIDWQRRRSGIDAKSSNGLTQNDRDTINAIKRAMADGSWCAGNIVPHRYAKAVYGDALPEALHAAMDASTAKSTVARIAEQVDVDAGGFTHHVQPAKHRDLATDHAEHQHPQMSYRLRQVHDVLQAHGHTPPYEELAMREAMDYLGVHNTTERLSVMVEAHGCRLIAKGTPTGPVTVRQHERRRPGMKQTGLTLEAKDDQGFCAYDGTGISFSESGLENLD